MKTLIIPILDEFNNYKQKGFKEVKIKNNPDAKDYHKITNVLPGLCVGYCPEVYSIGETKKPIEIIDFYDIRQKGVKKLKGHFITLKN